MAQRKKGKPRSPSRSAFNRKGTNMENRIRTLGSKDFGSVTKAQCDRIRKLDPAMEVGGLSKDQAERIIEWLSNK